MYAICLFVCTSASVRGRQSDKRQRGHAVQNKANIKLGRTDRTPEVDSLSIKMDWGIEIWKIMEDDANNRNYRCPSEYKDKFLLLEKKNIFLSYFSVESSLVENLLEYYFILSFTY